MADKTGEGTDVENFRAYIEKIEAALKNLRTVRHECTSIGRSKNRIEKLIQSMETGIKESVKGVLAELLRGAKSSKSRTRRSAGSEKLDSHGSKVDRVGVKEDQIEAVFFGV